MMTNTAWCCSPILIQVKRVYLSREPVYNTPPCHLEDTDYSSEGDQDDSLSGVPDGSTATAPIGGSSESEWAPGGLMHSTTPGSIKQVEVWVYKGLPPTGKEMFDFVTRPCGYNIQLVYPALGPAANHGEPPSQPDESEGIESKVRSL